MMSDAVIPIRNALSSTLRTSPWECTTPFGVPVVPEVYMMKAGASGSTAAARASIAVRSTSAGSMAPQAMVPGAAVSVSTTWRSAGNPGSETGSADRGRRTTSRISAR